jgi:hypothetical protein
LLVLADHQIAVDLAHHRERGLEKPRSKPLPSIRRTANPIPALDRTRRRLLAKRLRKGESGTNRVPANRPPGKRAVPCDAVTRTPSVRTRLL